MDLKHNVLFKVSLSNGENLYENKGELIPVAGEPSPWNKLLEYIAEKQATITSLSLYTDDGRTFNLPSAGRDPKFTPFAVAEKPIDFKYSHYIGHDMDVVGGKVENAVASDWFAVIEAIYPDYKLQLWVDENNTRNSWVLVVKNG